MYLINYNLLKHINYYSDQSLLIYIKNMQEQIDSISNSEKSDHNLTNSTNTNNLEYQKGLLEGKLNIKYS